MSLFNLDMNEVMTFFAVLVRFSVLFSVLPFFGDRMVPGPVKILMSLLLSILLFPALRGSGYVKIADARIWSATTSGLVGTLALEVMFGLALGYVARLIFDAILIGGNLVGNFMGYSAATTYDPHQESQTEVIAHLQTTLAMLLFLTLDGHHLLLRAVVDSYKFVGIGRIAFSEVFAQKLIQMTGNVFEFGVRLSAPVALGLFTVNLIFGIISRALPAMNVLVLSFAVNAFVGFFVLWVSLYEFSDSVTGLFAQLNEWLHVIILTLSRGG